MLNSRHLVTSLSAYALHVTLLGACGDAAPATGSDSTTEPATTTTTATTDPDTTTSTSTTLMLVCEPGRERCVDEVTREVCKPSGLDWEPEACGNYQTCTEQGGEKPIATCVGPCEVASANPTSVGCEFLAIRVRSGNGEEDVDEFYDAVLVGNPDKKTAEVQLYLTPNAGYLEEPVGEPVVLATGESHIFPLTNSTIKGFSAIRTGGVYRVKSDVPVIAYLHSPLKNSDSNDSSMLLPVKSLRQDYIVASYPAWADPKNPKALRGRPSFFNVIALEDKTTIEWTPPVRTAGNGLTPAVVEVGEVGDVTLNRFEVMQIGASTLEMDNKTFNTDYIKHDISGTLIHADKPIWVLSGTACAYVPFDSPGYCNHLQEQMLPVEYWGTKYIAAHSPLRADEKHYWRVYAGTDGINVTVDPPDVHPTINLKKRGDWVEFSVPNGKSFSFSSTGPFLPVQYLASSKSAGGNGDSAMYQTIPIEQYLSRYVFVTGVNYTKNYAQIVHASGSAPIKINGVEVPEDAYYPVNSFKPIGKYFVADVPLEAGDEPKFYVAESDDPFALSVIGYVGMPGDGYGSAYAYPGGMSLKIINPDGGQ